MALNGQSVGMHLSHPNSHHATLPANVARTAMAVIASRMARVWLPLEHVAAAFTPASLVQSYVSASMSFQVFTWHLHVDTCGNDSVKGMAL